MKDTQSSLFYDIGALRQFFSISRELPPNGIYVRFIATMIICMASSGVAVWAPTFISKIFNSSSGNEYSLTASTPYFIAFILLRLVSAILTDIRWILFNPALYQLAYRFNRSVTTHFVSSVGAVAARQGLLSKQVAEYVAVAQKAQLAMVAIVSNIIVTLIPSLVEIVVISLVLIFTFGVSGLLIVAIGVITFSISFLLYQATEQAHFSKATTLDHKVFARIGETISFSQLATQFEASNFFEKRVDSVVSRSLEAHQRFFLIKTFRSIFKSVLGAIYYGGAIFLLFASNKDHSVAAGSLFLLVFYVDRLYAPMNAAAAALASLRSSLRSIGVSRSLLDALIAEVGKRAHFKSPAIWSVAGKGRWIRLKGSSGAGKSTALLEAYDLLSRGGSRTGARRVVYLGQEAAIFDGAVNENIALAHNGPLGAVEALFDRFWAPLRLNGSQVTLVSPAGDLSGGERQAVALARASLHKPDVLIIDEATSGLDEAAERSILQTLRETLPATIVYFVSHRPANPVAPDLVIDFDAGAPIPAIP